MPKYRVHLYNVHLDAFEVEAPTAADARQLAYDYEYVMDTPDAEGLAQLAGRVTHVIKHAYQYEETPEVFALTPSGECVPLGEGDDDEESIQDEEPPT